MWLWIEMKGWRKLNLRAILWEWTLWASSLKATKETEKSCASLRYFVSGPVIRRQLPSWQKQLFLDGRHWRQIANYPLYTILFPSSDLPHFYPSSSLYPCTLLMSSLFTLQHWKNIWCCWQINLLSVWAVLQKQNSCVRLCFRGILKVSRAEDGVLIVHYCIIYE